MISADRWEWMIGWLDSIPKVIAKSGLIKIFLQTTQPTQGEFYSQLLRTLRNFWKENTNNGQFPMMKLIWFKKSLTLWKKSAKRVDSQNHLLHKSGKETLALPMPEDSFMKQASTQDGLSLTESTYTTTSAGDMDIIIKLILPRSLLNLQWFQATAQCHQFIMRRLKDIDSTICQWIEHMNQRSSVQGLESTEFTRAIAFDQHPKYNIL